MIPALLKDMVADARAFRENWRYTNMAEFSALPAQPALQQQRVFTHDETVIEDIGGAADVVLQRQHFTVQSGATLHHVRLTDFAEGQAGFLHTQVTVEAGARYEFFTLTAGAHRLRQEITVDLAGAGAHTALGCAYVLDGAAHHDLAVRINHMAPGCTSRQHIKGVARGTARAAFSGKIYVDSIAQQTDAYQLHKALLLSDRAEVNAKPELEIYADQVRCSHGNAMGDLDADALFLLRQRGLPEDDARALLVRAFVADALDDAPAEQRLRLQEKLAAML